MRQVAAMLKQIDKRTHNELAIQASFHGIRMPLKGEPAKPIETTEAEVAAIEKAMQESKLRKAQEKMRLYG